MSNEKTNAEAGRIRCSAGSHKGCISDNIMKTIAFWTIRNSGFPDRDRQQILPDSRPCRWRERRQVFRISSTTAGGPVFMASRNNFLKNLAKSLDKRRIWCSVNVIDFKSYFFAFASEHNRYRRSRVWNFFSCRQCHNAWR